MTVCAIRAKEILKIPHICFFHVTGMTFILSSCINICSLPTLRGFHEWITFGSVGNLTLCFGTNSEGALYSIYGKTKILLFLIRALLVTCTIVLLILGSWHCNHQSKSRKLVLPISLSTQSCRLRDGRLGTLQPQSSTLLLQWKWLKISWWQLEGFSIVEAFVPWLSLHTFTPIPIMSTQWC